MKELVQEIAETFEIPSWCSNQSIKSLLHHVGSGCFVHLPAGLIYVLFTNGKTSMALKIQLYGV